MFCSFWSASVTGAFVLMKVTEFKQLTHFLFLETVIMICSFLWFPGWKWKFTRDSCKLLFLSLSLALVLSCAGLVRLLVIPLNGELTGRLDLKKKKKKKAVSSKLKGPGPAVECIFMWNVMAKTWRTAHSSAATHEQLIVLRQVLCSWPSYEGLWVLLEHSPVHSGKFV